VNAGHAVQQGEGRGSAAVQAYLGHCQIHIGMVLLPAEEVCGRNWKTVEVEH